MGMRMRMRMSLSLLAITKRVERISKDLVPFWKLSQYQTNVSRQSRLDDECE